MRTKLISAICGFGLLITGVESANCASINVAPLYAVVVPSESPGEGKVVLMFDLSGMREGPGRVIESAILDWNVGGVSAASRSEFSVYTVTSAWTSESVGLGTPVAVGEDAVSEWEIEPLDYERNGGGFVRFDISDLVRSWDTNELGNYGVFISTPDVSSEDLGGSFSGASLTVRYSFVEE